MKILLLLLFPLSFLSAKSFSPQELAELARERTPVIKMYLEGVKVSEGQIKEARIWGNPTLTFQGGQVRSEGESGKVLDFTLMQPIPWPGKKTATVKSQEFYAQIAEMDLAEAKLHLDHRVYLLAYHLAYETEIEKQNKDRKARISLIAKYLSSRPLASPKLILERDMITSQIRLVEKLMFETTARKKGLTQELSLLTGLKDPAVEVDWEKLPATHPKEFYLANIEESFKLKKLKRRVQIGESKVEEAKLQARPDIMVGVNYRREETEPANSFYHGQVAVVIPIVDRGQYSVQTARAQVRREEASVKLALQEAEAELSHAYENLLASQEGLKLFPLSLKKISQDRFKNAEEAFRKGQIDVTTFLQSDNQIHENISLIYSSRLEYLAGMTQLEEIIGHSLEGK